MATPRESQLKEAEDLNGSLSLEPNKGKYPQEDKQQGNEKMDDWAESDFFDVEGDDDDIRSYTTANSVSVKCAPASIQQEQLNKLKKQLQSKSHKPHTSAQQGENRRSILEEQLKRAFQEMQQAQARCMNQEDGMKKLREDKRRLEQSCGQLQKNIAELKEHHRAQCQKLDRKHTEFEAITKRYKALESDFEAMLLQKDVKINELKGSLNMDQSRCSQLESEKIHQQQYAMELEAKIASFEHTVGVLTKHFEWAQAGLHSIDALLLKNQTPQGVTACLSHDDRMARLHRALANPKETTDEIIKLQELLKERDRDLHLLRTKDSQSLGKLTALSEEKTRQYSRISCLQKELSELQKKATNFSQLQQQIQPLIAERDALRELNEKSGNRIKGIQAEVLRLNQDNGTLRQKCDRLMEDNWKLTTKRDKSDELRLEMDRNRDLLAQAKLEVDRLSKLHEETSRKNDILNYELSKLSDVAKELEEQRKQYANLKRNMQSDKINLEHLKMLKIEKDNLQKELDDLQKRWEREMSANCSKCLEKSKVIRKAEIQMAKLQKTNKRQAKIIKEHLGNVDQGNLLIPDVTVFKRNVQQIKEYIKKQTNLGKTATDHDTSETCQSFDGTTEASTNSTELTYEHFKQIEQRCCDQIAEESKSLSSHMRKAGEKYQCLQGKYEQRLKEVELLMRTITEERAQSTKILDAKNAELKSILGKSREKERLIADLQHGFDDVFSNIDSERQSMKTVLEQWESQKMQVMQVEKYWQDRIAVMQSHHQQAMQTAQNHRLYAEEKAIEYKESLARMKQRMEEYQKRYALRESQQREASENEPHP
ncbi:protein Hook homolog 1-like isoform X1 [Drosophila pseudoobscura]|uniref:Protein Hook homolog 1-like isoform X1 n=1 Tax=Drosophila pseudoobscura pseudoobscura TaxID=46245 RepID=A0A6I8V3J4_DROPS|nr:protein Hook homolog 1 isoform X1 [Drosophila pseudoobscura]